MLLIFALLSCAIALTLPVVQTKIARYLTQVINRDYHTNIQIDQASFTLFGDVKLKKVLILDSHKDTLIYANRIQASFQDFKKLIDKSDLIFNELRLDGLYMQLKIYKGDTLSNLDEFIAAFDDGKPSTNSFLFTANNAYLSNSRFLYLDLNFKDPRDAEFTQINAELSQFQILGSNVTTSIDRLSFLDYRGLYVKNASTQFSYTKEQIRLQNIDMITPHSLYKGDVTLKYTLDDFSDFNNRVRFFFTIDQASLASDDIRYFYDELAKGKNFTLKGHITGTLNHLTFRKLRVTDGDGSVVAGNITFINSFGREDEPFYMKGNFSNLTSNYSTLTTLLPNVLGKNLPVVMQRFGTFQLKGTTELTANTLLADCAVQSKLGLAKAKFSMDNLLHLDQASYKGNLQLTQFNMGELLQRTDVGKVSLNVDVDGMGFEIKQLNSTFTGAIAQLEYNKYNYSNIQIDGRFKNPVFNGKLIVNDPNLFLDFMGSVNLTKKEIAYDFHAAVDYANLHALHFNTKDSISVFKGDVNIQLAGTTADNIKGSVYLTETSYQNKKDTYYFDDFNISSTFDTAGVRTIAIASPDIINGKIQGKFQVKQLQPILENALGSLYANYSPNKVKAGQFMKFDFTVYNKVIDVFYPGISIATNTDLKGSINADKNEFKFQFSSPEIAAYETVFNKINVQIDNKNPLYNAYIELDSIKTKLYKIRDFSLINVTTNDTLFVRSEFKGGEKGEDSYALNLYHTINKLKQSIVGIQKSELKYKDFLWYLNEKDGDDNKVIFDQALHHFTFDNLMLSHEDQYVSLTGNLTGSTDKDLFLNFNSVPIDKILPSIDDFSPKGFLNGSVNLKQLAGVYQPVSKIAIDELAINNVMLGRLNLELTGDEALRKFNLLANIENKEVESFTAQGEVEVSTEKTNLNMDLNFDNFNLGVLSSFGGDILTDIRGLASGRSNLSGELTNLDINGRLFVNKAGVRIPYLNVDYTVADDVVVDVTENNFYVSNAQLFDKKHNTSGTLNGTIAHKNFSDWKFDLAINSKRLLALDTNYSEDAAYYGTAFMDGSASITGPLDALKIKVVAKSEKGTQVKIPISDAESTDTNNALHFITKNEKYKVNKGAQTVRNYNGIDLEFDFDITPDAEVEIVLDRNSGHGMKGKGFGSLLIKINTLGKFNMWGDFQAYEGVYNFRYGGLINKKFKVKKGGSISWEGDPMRANLNLEAVYSTTANPGVLIENASFNKKVPTDVVIGLKGNLSNPEPNFEINFPTVSTVLQSEIQTKLDDKDIRQKQALILLSTGGFLSVDGLNQSSIKNNLYEKVGDLFGSVFNDNDGKFVVGVDIVSADTNPGANTDGRLGVNFTTKLNERISINGKVGVPIGGVNESTIVGDVEIQYRVNEDGTLNLKVFNKENNVNYFVGEGVGYTQGIGISYEVDFETFKQLLQKIFVNQKVEKLSSSSTQKEVQDSDILPDFIHLNNQEKKEPENKTPNREGLPPEE